MVANQARKCGFATFLDPRGGRPAPAGLGALMTVRVQETLAVVLGCTLVHLKCRVCPRLQPGASLNHHVGLGHQFAKPRHHVPPRVGVGCAVDQPQWRAAVQQGLDQSIPNRQAVAPEPAHRANARSSRPQARRSCSNGLRQDRRRNGELCAEGHHARRLDAPLKRVVGHRPLPSAKACSPSAAARTSRHKSRHTLYSLPPVPCSPTNHPNRWWMSAMPPAATLASASEAWRTP